MVETNQKEMNYCIPPTTSSEGTLQVISTSFYRSWSYKIRFSGPGFTQSVGVAEPRYPTPDTFWESEPLLGAAKENS